MRLVPVHNGRLINTRRVRSSRLSCASGWHRAKVSAAVTLKSTGMPLHETMNLPAPVIEIDGHEVDTLDGFFRHFSELALGGFPWGRNLDAFNAVLRGGFGTPDGGFVLRWKNHGVSRERLGYAETVTQLTERPASCHPDNRWHVARELEAASRCEWPTVFDWLVEIIRDH